MKKQILLIALLALFSSFSEKTFAVCQADFTWSQIGPNAIGFTNTSTGTGFLTSYYWDFGNGDYDSNSNPVHTFAIPGTYTVCLIISDSTCTSTSCQTVTVTGSLICNVATTAYQTQAASCPTCADGTAYAYVTGGTEPYTYSWSNGETTSSISGLLAGTYTVCVNDFNGCSDCSYININSSSCQALFYGWQISANVITFVDSSQGTGNFTWYSWDFGDGTYGYEPNPVHTYSAPGTYWVCLSIQDSSSNSCSSTYCDSVTVTGSVLCNVSVTAYQFQLASCGTCADGAAYAIASGGTAPYVYSWSNGDTQQTVTGLAVGTYTVCATDANGCSACTTIDITDSTNFFPCAANFYMSPDSTSPHTYYIVNLSYGTSPITYTWSWGDGTYDTSEFPSHTYSAPGYYQICLTITSGGGCTATYCDSAMVLRHSQNSADAMIQVNVISPEAVGIFSDAVFKTLSVYPNPVTAVLNISFGSGKNQMADYKIFSLEGMEMMNGIFSAKENKLNVEKLSAGVYILQLSDADGNKSFRKIVKE